MGEARTAMAWANVVPVTSLKTSVAKEEPSRLLGGLAAVSGVPSSGKWYHSLVFGDNAQ